MNFSAQDWMTLGFGLCSLIVSVTAAVVAYVNARAAKAQANEARLQREQSKEMAVAAAKDADRAAQQADRANSSRVEANSIRAEIVAKINEHAEAQREANRIQKTAVERDDKIEPRVEIAYEKRPSNLHDHSLNALIWTAKVHVHNASPSRTIKVREIGVCDSEGGNRLHSGLIRPKPDGIPHGSAVDYSIPLWRLAITYSPQDWANVSKFYVLFEHSEMYFDASENAQLTIADMKAESEHNSADF